MGGIPFMTGVVFGVDPGYRQLALCRSLAGGFVFVSGMALATGVLFNANRVYRQLALCRSGVGGSAFAWALAKTFQPGLRPCG